MLCDHQPHYYNQRFAGLAIEAGGDTQAPAPTPLPQACPPHEAPRCVTCSDGGRCPGGHDRAEGPRPSCEGRHSCPSPGLLSEMLFLAARLPLLALWTPRWTSLGNKVSWLCFLRKHLYLTFFKKSTLRYNLHVLKGTDLQLNEF